MTTFDGSKKWASLNKMRQLQILLDLVNSIMLNPDHLSALSQLKEKVSIFKINHDNDLVQVFLLHNKFSKTNTAEDLHTLLLYLERLCSINIPETNFLVRSVDRKNKKGALSKHPLRIIVEDLRSSFNIGAIFRTADCLSIEHIYLTGYTPTPDNSGTRKSALGADEVVPWSHHTQISEAINLAKEQGFQIWALETADTAQSLYDIPIPEKIAFVLGNERFGIRPQTLSLCHNIIEVPTYGFKNSLNVSHCMAICGYEVVRQWNL